MANLLDSVKGLLSKSILVKVGNLIGEDAESTSAAILSFLPALIGGTIHSSREETGASAIMKLIKTGGFGESHLSDISSLLGDNTKINTWMETGTSILGTLMGDKQSSIMDLLAGTTQIKKSSASTLMTFLGPLLLNKLAGMVFKNNWSIGGMSAYLAEQQSSIADLVPGLPEVLGFAAPVSVLAEEAMQNENDKNKSDSTSPSNHTKKATSTDSTKGSTWWKWLLLILAVGGLIWYLTKDGCGVKEPAMETVVADSVAVISSGENTGNSVENMSPGGEIKIDYTTFVVEDNGDIKDSTGMVVYTGGSYGFDEMGNIVDEEERVLINVAELPTSMADKIKAYLGLFATSKLSIDPSGNLVDSKGTILLKKGKYFEKDGFFYNRKGTKLGKIWSKVVKAIGNAAEKSLDAMRSLFSGMLTKKDGTKATYSLSNITFNPENHRITNFSKEEVEGLAAALKENATGKIVVQAFTKDGINDAANKDLSKTRAQVVHDMLVALGVPNGQISFEGMGTGENNVEIKVK